MRSNVKSAIATPFLASLIMLAMTSTARAGDKGCSNRTLSGSYGATLTGTVNGEPFAALDSVTSDGHGNITGTGTISLDGTIIPSTFTATYTVNSDCTGSFSSSSGTTENLVITQDGSEVQFIVTATALGPATVTGSAKSLGK
ncbi:MAG TPA: hypothetical protein VL523_14280 [Terriglobia bacterium]|nr:hypothetical protein [Terriglobia bacterium]